MKKKILVVVSLLVVVALLTTGAFAYFTTGTRTASGNIRSGTMDLLIAGVVPSANCSTNVNDYGVTAKLWDLTNMAPGDELDGKLCMMNTGTLPIAQVVFKWTGMSGDLASHLFVTELRNSVTGNEIDAYIGALDGITGEVRDNKMSLAELNAGINNWSLPPSYGGIAQEYWVGHEAIFLGVGSIQSVEYTFVFDPNAGNELQGANFNYTLDVTGVQNPVFP